MKKLILLIPMIILFASVVYSTGAIGGGNGTPGNDAILWLNDYNNFISGESDYADWIDFGISIQLNIPGKTVNLTNLTFVSNMSVLVPVGIVAGGGATNNKTISFSNVSSGSAFVTQLLNHSSAVYEGCWYWSARLSNGSVNNSPMQCLNTTLKPYNITWKGNNTIADYDDITLLRNGSSVTFSIDVAAANPAIVNISDVLFYFNVTGDVSMNNTNITLNDGSKTNDSMSLNYTKILSLPTEIISGSTFCWYWSFNDTTSAGGASTINITDTWCIKTYYHPNITNSSTAFADDYYLNSSEQFRFNFTVDGNADNYNCDLYTNEPIAGAITNWTSKVSIGALNATNTEFLPYNFTTDGSYTYAVKCQEAGFSNKFGWGVNRTINVDRIDPVVSILYIKSDASAPIDGTGDWTIPSGGYLKTFNFSSINVSLTETNIESCSLYVNWTTVDGFLLNMTNDTMSDYIIATGTSVFPMNASHNLSGDGVYLAYVSCRDLAGTVSNTSIFNFTRDTVHPSLNLTVPDSNYSIDSCVSYGVNYTILDDLSPTLVTNTTLYYGLDSNTGLGSNFNTSDSIYRTNEITFDENIETNFFTNITICDAAGNCNSTANQWLNSTSPVPLCSGWSAYTAYEGNNISNLNDRLNVDFTYWWNDTGQTWVYDGGFEIIKGDVLFFFTSTDSTLFRVNGSGVPNPFNYNRTVVADATSHNFLGLSVNTSFSVVEYLRNITGGMQVAGEQNYTFSQPEYFAGWNNSAQKWVNHLNGAVWHNTTTLGNNSNQLDAYWMYALDNITISFNVSTTNTQTIYAFANVSGYTVR